MFVKEYELRYSDIARNGKLKTSTVLDLLQDISIAHADYVGLGTKRLKELSLACLLAGWRICFLKQIDIKTKIIVKTGIMDVTKCEAYRKYEIWQNNECKVTATATWFTVNTEKMRIARVTQELFSVFESVSEEDNNFPCVNLRPVKDMDFLDETIVKKRDLDTNNHMNNVKSVEIALDFVPEVFEFSELQVKYRKELKMDEKIKIYGTVSGGEAWLEIRNEKDDPCVLVHVIK